MSRDLQMLQLLGSMDSIKPQMGGRQGTRQVQGKGDDAAYQAFDVQMRMMRQLLHTSPDTGADSFNLTSVAFEDERMYDALSTISRLFQRQNPRHGMGADKLFEHESSGASSVQPSVMQSTGYVKADNTVYQVVGGELSAVFESGTKGVGCIGYDRVGGTSYGSFQIASRTGSMDRFIKFLKTEAPDIAKRLDHGHFNTGSKRGVVPNIWKRIAAESPERFESLQRDFIKQDHYSPARRKILAATGVDIDQTPKAVREVLWSTSVQHGPTGAARIFNRAIGVSKLENGETNFERLVSKIYDTRKHQFDSSSSRVRRSVQNRLVKEQNIALAMLKNNSGVNQLV